MESAILPLLNATVIVELGISTRSFFRCHLDVPFLRGRTEPTEPKLEMPKLKTSEKRPKARQLKKVKRA